MRLLLIRALAWLLGVLQPEPAGETVWLHMDWGPDDPAVPIDWEAPEETTKW